MKAVWYLVLCVAVVVAVVAAPAAAEESWLTVSADWVQGGWEKYQSNENSTGYSWGTPTYYSDDTCGSGNSDNYIQMSVTAWTENGEEATVYLYNTLVAATRYTVPDYGGTLWYAYMRDYGQWAHTGGCSSPPTSQYLVYKRNWGMFKQGQSVDWKGDTNYQTYLGQGESNPTYNHTLDWGQGVGWNTTVYLSDPKDNPPIGDSGGVKAYAEVIKDVDAPDTGSMYTGWLWTYSYEKVFVKFLEPEP